MSDRRTATGEGFACILCSVAMAWVAVSRFICRAHTPSQKSRTSKSDINDEFKFYLKFPSNISFRSKNSNFDGQNARCFLRGLYIGLQGLSCTLHIKCLIFINQAVQMMYVFIKMVGICQDKHILLIWQF